MALRTAKAFKNFLIDSNLSQGVFFGMDTPIDISVKCDNFAEQVQVYNVIEAINLFEYKYITFDGKTVFEITDCLQCDNYYTLFITLLSRVKLEQWDSDFLLTKSTPTRLYELGFGFSQWLEIFGGAKINFNSELLPTNDIIGWGVKITLSAIPNNLGAYKYIKNALSPTPKQMSYGANEHGRGTFTYTMTNPDDRIGSIDKFTITQQSYVVIIPIPLGLKTKFMATSGITNDTTVFSYDLTWKDFVDTLTALISDLTLRVELVPLASNINCIGTLYSNDFKTNKFDFKPMQVYKDNDTYIYKFLEVNKIDPDNNQQSNVETWANGGIACVYSGMSNAYPFIFLEFGIDAYYSPQLTSGFGYVYGFLPIIPLAPTDSGVIVAYKFLGNIIEVNGLSHNNIVLQVLPNKIRFYLDYFTRNFVDLENAIEYDKSAFSNYEAYTKANLQITQQQQTETLKMQQKQALREQEMTNMRDRITGAASAAKGALSGGFMGGGWLGGIIGAGAAIAENEANIAFNNAMLNQRQQNERANLRLSQIQAHDSLRSTIVPSSTFNGAVNLSDVIRFDYYATGVFSLEYTAVYIDSFEQILLYDYLINKTYLETVDNAQLVMPNYTPAGKPVQCMFTASPITNNKSFVALCKPLLQS